MHANIKMVSYQDINKKITSDNLIICINSLELLRDIPEMEFNDYVVYIDEITSFLLDITNKDTISNKLKSVFTILMKIMKNCHILILSAPSINYDTFNLIKSRQNLQIHFIDNTFIKFDGVKAFHYHDETEFLNKMIENVKASQYFLIVSDTCTSAGKFYYKCFENCNETDKDNFILITAESNFKLIDAST